MPTQHSGRPDARATPVTSDAEFAEMAAGDPDVVSPVERGPDGSLVLRGEIVPLARKLRLRLKLSQQAFADRYGIPVACIRDWEQGRSKPDSAVASYLLAIAGSPDAVAEAFAASCHGLPVAAE